MDTITAVAGLKEFIKTLATNNIRDRKAFRQFCLKNEDLVSALFNYDRYEGMPAIGELLSIDYHETLPLILLNYSTIAHNTLHAFPEGWTPVLRLCRGIVFDTAGNLIALPFPKFFNYNQHPETIELPNLPFKATEKHDGHLGIIFRYNGQLILTTRGRFNSPSSILGNEMLKRYVGEYNWDQIFPESITALVEMIHPQTFVHKKYYGEKTFIIIGAMNTKKLFDFNYDKLTRLANLLHVKITQPWSGDNLQNLIQLMKDRSVTNEEGYVIRFENGLRVKIKFESYIGLMVASKLSYSYLMNRMISGNLEKMLATLPEEIYDTAMNMLGKILMDVSSPGTLQQKWTKLYGLNPTGSSYYKQTCRTFVKHLLKKQE